MVRSIVRWILEFTEQQRAIRTVLLTLIYSSTLVVLLDCLSSRRS